MKRKEIKGIVLLILFISAFFSTLYYFGVEFECVFHKYLGIYCPACGLTRMLLSILNLNFYQAFRYNALFFIYLVLFIIYCIVDILYFINIKKHIEVKMNVYLVLLITLLTFTILRNIPMFSFLQPTLVN